MVNRVRLLPPEAALPFLPPSSEFLKIVGVSGGFGGLVRHLAAKHGLSVPDAKTLRNAEKASGVSLRSAERIEEVILEGLPNGLKQDLQHADVEGWLDVKARNNGLAWSSMIKGFRHSVLPRNCRETRAEIFVRNRAMQEREMLRDALAIKNAYPASIADEKFTELLVRFFSTHTKVCREHIRAAITAVAAKPTSSSPDNCFLILSLGTGFKVDFYYRLLCEISLDLVELFLRTDEVAVKQHRQWLIEEGCFGDISPRPDENEVVPFEMFLRSWLALHESQGQGLNWTDIAKCLPDPYSLSAEESCARGQTVGERKADMLKNKNSRLREWRQGTRPEDEQLRVFIQRLTHEHGDYALTLLRARIAVMWGSFIKAEKKIYEGQGLENRFASLLPTIASYHHYWADCRPEVELIIGRKDDSSPAV